MVVGDSVEGNLPLTISINEPLAASNGRFADISGAWSKRIGSTTRRVKSLIIIVDMLNSFKSDVSDKSCQQRTGNFDHVESG